MKQITASHGHAVADAAVALRLRSCSIALSASRRKSRANMRAAFGECPLSGKPDMTADIGFRQKLTRNGHWLGFPLRCAYESRCRRVLPRQLPSQNGFSEQSFYLYTPWLCANVG